MVAERWFNIRELGEMAGLAETSARRYVSRFNEFFPSRQYGRVTKYPAELVEVLTAIAQWFKDGLTTEEIKERLAGTHEIVVDVTESNVQEATVLPQTRQTLIIKQQQALFAELAATKNEVLSLRQELADLREERQLAEQELNSTLAEMGLRLSRVETHKQKRRWWPFGT